MDVPADWVFVEADGKFTFWLPPTLKEVQVSSSDSYTRRWESQNVIVSFDYGQFSDPLTLYTQRRSYQVNTESIGGYSATLVSFEREDGWWFSAIHFPVLASPSSSQTDKLTLVVESSPEVDKAIAIAILKSVRF